MQTLNETEIELLKNMRTEALMASESTGKEWKRLYSVTRARDETQWYEVQHNGETVLQHVSFETAIEKYNSL